MAGNGSGGNTSTATVPETHPRAHSELAKHLAGKVPLRLLTLLTYGDASGPKGERRLVTLVNDCSIELLVPAARSDDVREIRRSVEGCPECLKVFRGELAKRIAYEILNENPCPKIEEIFDLVFNGSGGTIATAQVKNHVDGPGGGCPVCGRIYRLVKELAYPS
ncbi:MAG: hypothetical protein Q7S03_04225 [bacterium]|nr:hypothetical protein [bacterium]